MSKKKQKAQAGKQVKGGTGITSGRDVRISSINGQVAIGENITQTLTKGDKKELHDNLAQFQNEIAKLKLPQEKAAVINEDMAAAVKEAAKDNPDPQKIQGRFEGALKTVEEVGNTIETVSKWEWTKKILGILGKVGKRILL
jgi:hypothetical protein